MELTMQLEACAWHLDAWMGEHTCYLDLCLDAAGRISNIACEPTEGIPQTPGDEETQLLIEASPIEDLYEQRDWCAPRSAADSKDHDTATPPSRDTPCAFLLHDDFISESLDWGLDCELQSMLRTELLQEERRVRRQPRRGRRSRQRQRASPRC